MSAALALLVDGAGAEVRVIATCCGGHRPASDCPCCAECVTNTAVGRQTPDERAAVARDIRARVVAYLAEQRLNARRADQLATCAAIDDCLRSLAEATTNIVHQANAVHDEYPPAPVNRWFTHMQGVLA